MIEIRGVVVEVTCETCNGSGVVKGAFIPHIACQHCEGGVKRRSMSFAELKLVLARTAYPTPTEETVPCAACLQRGHTAADCPNRALVPGSTG